MKKIIFALSFLISTTLCFTQNQELPQQVRNEFCKTAILNYQYGTDAFKAWMLQSARSIGLNNIADIDIAIENISKHKDLQEEFFKSVFRIGGSSDFIYMQFIGIGMTEKNAKILCDYVIDKYSFKNKKAENISSIKVVDLIEKDVLAKKETGIQKQYVQNALIRDVISKNGEIFLVLDYVEDTDEYGIYKNTNMKLRTFKLKRNCEIISCIDSLKLTFNNLIANKQKIISNKKFENKKVIDFKVVNNAVTFFDFGYYSE